MLRNVTVFLTLNSLYISGLSTAVTQKTVTFILLYILAPNTLGYFFTSLSISLLIFTFCVAFP